MDIAKAAAVTFLAPCLVTWTIMAKKKKEKPEKESEKGLKKCNSCGEKYPRELFFGFLNSKRQHQMNKDCISCRTWPIELGDFK